MAGVDILAQAFSGGKWPRFWAISTQDGRPTPPRSTRVSPDLFDAMDDEARAVLADVAGADWAPQSTPDPVIGQAIPAATTPTNEQVRAATIASLRALMLIRSYRVAATSKPASTH